MNSKQNKKQQVAIPGFLWAIVVILVLSIIFFFIVQSPFSQRIDEYNSKHDSAQSQINLYEDYLRRAEEVEAKIAQMKEKYNEESKKLFVNATQSPADILEMVSQLKIEPNSVSVNEGSVDGQGRKSATGDSLYVAMVSFNFEGTEAELVDALDYFELESDGSYYIEHLDVSPIGGQQGSKVTNELKYNIGITLSLYYFPPKIDEVSNDPIVSGSAAVVSAASTSSAASSKAA